MPDDYEKYAALARAVPVPLAAGEEETTALGLRATCPAWRR